MRRGKSALPLSYRPTIIIHPTGGWSCMRWTTCPAGIEPATTRLSVDNLIPSARLRGQGGGARQGALSTELRARRHPEIPNPRDCVRAPRKPNPACRSARRDSNPRPPSPVKLPPSARAGGQGTGEAFTSALYQAEPRASGILHPGKGWPTGVEPVPSDPQSDALAVELRPPRCRSYFDVGRRERPARREGSRCSTRAGTMDAPPALLPRTSLRQHSIRLPVLVFRMQTAPPAGCAGGAAYARSR